eukprot:NODE_326_length_1636_cov_87.172300_g294_i0.p1 GENE.NODE_326_length_1636_cov_87.172300_g294_i0~~NODE_326_length_1636_cov_87.172300_g294_i0.p1  ORF type:complete len:453 (-),score=35.44 NODE_326_length_1636_cov_87.172300_g294_i0:172-1530(-)
MFRRTLRIRYPTPNRQRHPTQRTPAYLNVAGHENPRFADFPATLRSYNPFREDGFYWSFLFNRCDLIRTVLWKYRPVAHLAMCYPDAAGRNNTGRIKSRFRKSSHPQWRLKVNYQYTLPEVPKKLIGIQHPGGRRSAWLGLVYYANGVVAYHPITDGMEQAIGSVIFQPDVITAPEPGQWRQLRNVPANASVCNVEALPGSGGTFARSAGTMCLVLGRTDEHRSCKVVPVLLPSREMRVFHEDSWCTIGRIGTKDKRLSRKGDPGVSNRDLGRRPRFRAWRADPDSHWSGRGRHRPGRTNIVKGIYSNFIKGWNGIRGRKYAMEYKPMDKMRIRASRDARRLPAQGQRAPPTRVRAPWWVEKPGDSHVMYGPTTRPNPPPASSHGLHTKYEPVVSTKRENRGTRRVNLGAWLSRQRHSGAVEAYDVVPKAVTQKGQRVKSRRLTWLSETRTW